MKHPVRTVVFWIHLAAGLTAGLIVAVMAATGAALAFERQLLEWAERGSARVTPPAPPAPRLALDDLVARARAAAPGGEPPTALTIYADPAAAVRVSAGRQAGVHVDPYRGDVRPLAGRRWRNVFQLMIEWHRWLGGTSPAGRAAGKAITGVANAAFLFLALSGLFLWWPRRFRRSLLRQSLWFKRGLAGKARDWNWHNVIGFWSLPVLIVVTASGMVISYRWVSNLVYRVAGETPPAAANPSGTGAAPAVPRPPTGARPLALDATLAAITREVPGWSSATVRLRGEQRGAQPLSLTVRQAGGWPPFATTQLTLDPFTGQTLRKETFAASSPGRKLRSWLRFLHTGEALGWPGQLAAGLASLGATLLVWTGLALACRRFLGWRRRRIQAPARGT
jgi:uncharacterized iron-regulated membrane protein